MNSPFLKKFALALTALLVVVVLPSIALAADAAAGGAAAGGANSLSINLTGNGLFTDRIVQIIALITILSLAPSILIMMTCFVRIVVVLSLLRTALGVQQARPMRSSSAWRCSSPSS